MRASSVVSVISLRAITVAVLVIGGGCADRTQPAPPSAKAPPDDPRMTPIAMPVGKLVAPAATPPSEARGLLAPSGTLAPEQYRARRRALMDRVGGQGAILVGNDSGWDGSRTGQDFYYLTGFDEPDAKLLLLPGEPVFKEVLFLGKRDVEAERWEGERAPLPSKELEVSTGIAKIRRVSGLGGALLTACEKYGSLVYVGGFASYDDKTPETLDILQKAAGQTLGCKVEDKHGELARMREVKEPEEQLLMRQAIAFTAKGQEAAIEAARPGAREFEVKDAIEDAFRRAGSRHVAFDSITGSGPNGAVLHYPKDDRVMQSGDLIVVDIGAEADRYAADVTRTLPVGGTYTPEQREIVELVLKAQEAGIAAAKAGATVEQVDLATRDVIAQAGYYDYYLHSCCHFVGLEVHDAGDYTKPLPVGAVITVEPGIYLPQRGFGVRIEDEVLITADGAELITGDIPKRPDDIERLMSGRK